MNLTLHWHPRIRLRLHQNGPLIYSCDLDSIPYASGIYVFGRRYGQSVSPIYIGKANNLHSRVKRQLNNLRLMRGIQQEPNGVRVLQIGEWIPRPGQQSARVLPIIEKTYIEHALSEGYDILNIQGTRLRFHTINSTGRRKAHEPFPRLMNRRRAR